MLGIIGGGQLALMLADAARRLGVSVRVLADSATEPAARASRPGELTVGSGSQAVAAFLRGCDHAIFENEFSDLAAFERAAPARLQWTPGLAAMAPLQDKLEQKRILGELGISHAPASLDLSDQRCARLAPKGFVLKWARYGYDGHGTLIVKPREWGRKGMRERVRAFIAEGESKGARVFQETLLSIRGEFASVASRTRDGAIAHYPLVESFQESGICREVWGPARLTARVAPAQERKLQKAWETLAAHLDWAGVLAIEWIRDRQGRFWVNEIAPRVHNTAHWTLDAPGLASQFENHVRASVGMPLGPAQLPPGVVVGMRNLLGPARPPTAAPVKGWKASLPSWAFLHWYGKLELRERRKLGHLNVFATPVGKKAVSWKRLRAQLARLESGGWWPKK